MTILLGQIPKMTYFDKIFRTESKDYAKIPHPTSILLPDKIKLAKNYYERRQRLSKRF